MKLLYVDDEEDIREIALLGLALDDAIELRDCSSGVEALELAQSWAPDIILLDVMMPILDGPSTLRRLRSERSTAHIPVIFVTARAQAQEQTELVNLGALGVISKPFDPVTLAAAVRKLVSERSR